MNLVLTWAVAFAAGLFIAVSAAMNALFLSSLGRSTIEIGLLAAVSLAADLVKAVLPVVIVRAVALRAWGQGIAASVLLAVVVTLSLASGTGFAALTRNTATASREAQAERLAGIRQEQRELEQRLAVLQPSRPLAVVQAEMDGIGIDHRWTASKSCAEVTGASVRQFCNGVFRLRLERTTASERDALAADRQRLRTVIEALTQAGAALEADPQAGAIADVFGVERTTPRRVLTSGLAVLLELGSVILVLLLAGSTVRGWRKPGSEPVPPIETIDVPEPPDRAYWRKQREKSRIANERGMVGHDR